MLHLMTSNRLIGITFDDAGDVWHTHVDLSVWLVLVCSKIKLLLTGC